VNAGLGTGEFDLGVRDLELGIMDLDIGDISWLREEA
jgi:hypothetical protein